MSKKPKQKPVFNPQDKVTVYGTGTGSVKKNTAFNTTGAIALNLLKQGHVVLEPIKEK